MCGCAGARANSRPTGLARGRAREAGRSEVVGMKSMSEGKKRLHAGWTTQGYVRCGRCAESGRGARVDLSDAETFEEAKETWNAHLRDVHDLEGPR